MDWIFILIIAGAAGVAYWKREDIMYWWENRGKK
jgi:hypothetical protein